MHDQRSADALPLVVRINAHDIDPSADWQGILGTAEGADALILVTEWNEFKNLDLERVRASMAQAVLIDGRNIYDPAFMKSQGFDYFAIGRGELRAAP